MRNLLLILLASALGAAEDDTGTPLQYEHAGETFTGALYLPDGASADAPAAGVLVVHEWWGLNDYARRRAAELAEAGYAAFACDMFGSPPVDTPQAASAQSKPFYADRELMRGRARAALDALAGHPQVDGERLGAIGFCFGGTVALELARSGAPLDALVSFHGGLTTPQPAAAGAIAGRVLVCHGGADPMVPPEDLAAFMQEMEEAAVDYRVEVYGGAVHAFTNPASETRDITGVDYDADAEAASLVAMLALFSETLGE